MSADITKKFNEIDGLLKKEAYSEAEQIGKDLLSKYPDNIIILKKLGDIQIYSDDEIETNALATFRKALTLSKDDPEIHAQIARIYFKNDQIDLANELIEKTLALNPYCGFAWAIKGKYGYKISNSIQDSLNAFEKAIKHGKTDYRIWMWYGVFLGESKYYNKAIDALTSASELFPDSIVILKELCLNLYLSGNYEQAIQISKKSLEINPNNSGNIIIFGLLSLEVGDYETAVKMLSSIESELNDENLSSLGEAYYSLGKFEESLPIFTNLSIKFPENSDYLVWMGSISYELNNKELALKYYNQALLIDPNNNNAHFNISKCHYLSGNNEEYKNYLLVHHTPILSTVLVKKPEPGASWVWLDGQPASKKGANKFMLCSSVDGYGPWNRAFTNSKKFSEEYLGDPDQLWEEILKNFAKDEWNSVELKKQFNLHHVMSWHSRVWDVAERVVNELDGDARKIWRKGDPDKLYGEEEEYDNETILDRLEYFLYNRKKYTDTQIPKMIIGALIDSGQLEGSIDVKADTHVIRVSGRVVYGIEDLREFVGDQNMAENIAVHTARLLSPENPWYVDQQFFAPGGIDKICTLHNPKCDRCNYNSFCLFKLGLRKDLPDLPKSLPSLKEFQKERGIESN